MNVPTPACVAATALSACLLAGCGPRRDCMYMPRIDGDWWQVAGNPDLGDLNGPPVANPRLPQQPVDFSVWQAADDTWQLWSCIRNTNCGGNTRLFYRWEGTRLFDGDWTPMGIAMQADCPRYETNVGGLQAPHVVKDGDTYCMIYGDWDYICIQRSNDGKHFERWLYDNGKPGMFTEGKGCNTRDPMLIRIGDKWHCYYTAFPKVDGRPTGGVYCRTSVDLRTWSDSKLVARGGMTGSSPSSSECPHVAQIGDYFYLFRTQRCAGPPTTSVYRSKDPMDFGIDDRADRKLVCLLEVAAPEIIFYNRGFYIAALMPDIQGIRVARLTWVLDLLDQRGHSLVWEPNRYLDSLFYQDFRGDVPDVE